MEFALQTGQQHRTYDDILALWRVADQLGYTTGWLYDHLIPVGGDPDGPAFEATALLSSLLSRTERIRGGILVACVQYRAPAVFAKQMTTIDHASGGRLDVGIGSCWNAWEAGLYDIDFPSFAERTRRLEAAIDTMRSHWDGSAEAHSGPPPVQRPGPPIWVGGTGASMPAIVAARADGWNAIFCTPEEYAGHAARVDEACEAAGRDPATLRRSFGQRVVVDVDRERAAARARQAYESQGVPFEPVADRVIAGAPADVAAAVDAYRAMGVDQFIVWHEPPFDTDADEQVRAFAESVIPLL